jgi:sec-independent protein translocase protein TatA
MIGTGELIVILCVVLILFGGKKLPELARSIGLGIREFKKACNGEDAEEPLEPPSQQLKKEPVTIVVESDHKDRNPHG